MAIHSKVKIWVHLIWGTYKREKSLTISIRKKLFEHLVQKSEIENIHIEKLFIRPDHVHMLIELPSIRTIQEVARLFKGESSYWIHQNNLVNYKFRWQRGYAAFSVSSSQLATIKKYIANQDSHHNAKSFNQEYEDWPEST